MLYRVNINTYNAIEMIMIISNNQMLDSINFFNQYGIDQGFITYIVS